MPVNSLPLVSVVVRTHNRSDSLRDAIECVLCQTYEPIEIIVMDHNSTDNTKEVVDHYSGRVKYYKHTGTYRDMFTVWREKVNGEFISFLDDDDYIKPECIEKLVNFLLIKNEVDVVFPRHRFFKVEHDRCLIVEESGKIENSDIKKLFLQKCVVSWNGVLLRRKCIKSISRLDPIIVGAFDWHFWIQLVIAGYKFYQFNEVLGYLQRSSDSAQFDIERVSKGVLQCMRRYAAHLSLKEKFKYEYYKYVGYNFIRHGIILIENGNIKRGRKCLLKGIYLYAFARKTIKPIKNLIVAVLIFFSSLISKPKKARKRIEKLVRNYYFRNYFEMEIIKNTPQPGFLFMETLKPLSGVVHDEASSESNVA